MLQYHKLVSITVSFFTFITIAYYITVHGFHVLNVPPQFMRNLLSGNFWMDNKINIQRPIVIKCMQVQLRVFAVMQGCICSLANEPTCSAICSCCDSRQFASSLQSIIVNICMEGEINGKMICVAEYPPHTIPKINILFKL